MFPPLPDFTEPFAGVSSILPPWFKTFRARVSSFWVASIVASVSGNRDGYTQMSQLFSKPDTCKVSVSFSGVLILERGWMISPNDFPLPMGTVVAGSSAEKRILPFRKGPVARRAATPDIPAGLGCLKSL